MAASLPQNDDGCYVVEVDSNSQAAEESCLKSVVCEMEETEAQNSGLVKPKSVCESSDSDRMNTWNSSAEGRGLKFLASDETALVHTSEIVKNEEKMGKCGESNSLGADVKEKNVQVLQEKGQKKSYSRKELEGLRNVGGVEGQMKKWTEIYCGLGSLVQENYDALVVRHQYRNQKTKKLGEGSSVCTAGKENPKEITFNLPPVKHENGCPTEQEYEEYDTDEEYSSILKPAFSVSGEPNFESGPPEDGFEYLRRVRWEAAQLPKVKIANVDESILSAEQTNYMPQIPDLAKCPEQLMPLKEWEDAFLADFSDLRMALSRCEDSEEHLQSAMCEERSSNLLETIAENFCSIPCEGDSSQSSSYTIPQTYDGPQCPVVAIDSNASNVIDNSASKASKREASVEYPTLSMVMQMDSVARVSALRKHISLAESASNLSRNDCIWLFALSAAVDSPLHADTCASFRSLLRKCALLRAEKSVVDEEVAMLNILATISGRYFGQLEH